MKRSVAKKIESLLAASISEPSESNPEKSIKQGIKISAARLGKFCRQLPISIFNLVRPAPKTGFAEEKNL